MKVGESPEIRTRSEHTPPSVHVERTVLQSGRLPPLAACSQGATFHGHDFRVFWLQGMLVRMFFFYRLLLSVSERAFLFSIHVVRFSILLQNNYFKFSIEHVPRFNCS